MINTAQKLLTLAVTGPIFMGSMALLVAGGAGMLVFAALEDKLKPLE